MSKPLVGDRIKVKVGGKDYWTVIDTQGVQRFIAGFEALLSKGYMGRKGVDLNSAAIIYGCQPPNEDLKRQYAEFNMRLGYSVSGFCDLSVFQDWEIDNPLWDEDRKLQHELTKEGQRCLHGYPFGTTCEYCKKQEE